MDDTPRLRVLYKRQRAQAGNRRVQEDDMPVQARDICRLVSGKFPLMLPRVEVLNNRKIYALELEL